MGSNRVSVRRVEFPDYEQEIKEILEEYQRWVAEQYRLWVSSTSNREEDTTPTSATEFAPDVYVKSELTKDLDYLRESGSERPIVVALDGDHVVGCVYLYRLTENQGEVKRLYVREADRGLGLGRRLMQALIDVASDEGYSTLQLSTTPVMQEAQALYRNLGFEPTGGHTSVSDIPIDEITYMEMSLENHQ